MEQLNNIELTSPCSKTIGELMPCEGGWFCNACNKKVHDFRQMSEEAILNKIGINTNICGAFKYEQINLAPRHFSFKRWLFTSFLAVGFSGLHQVVFAQSDSSKKIKENTLTVTTAKDTTKEKIRIGGVSKTKAALYIIDGKIASGNPLKKVNPNDILRIDVLKSDSALKVYGRRAKYGVIIVTTKKKP
jgi:hypothetical protein